MVLLIQIQYNDIILSQFIWKYCKINYNYKMLLNSIKIFGNNSWYFFLPQTPHWPTMEILQPKKVLLFILGVESSVSCPLH